MVPARDRLDPGGGQTSMDPARCGALVACRGAIIHLNLSIVIRDA